MQKRSHRQLATALLHTQETLPSRSHTWAFLFGSFQPDCNPLTYFRGFRRAHKLQGHNFSNTQFYIFLAIRRLQQKTRWNLWNYYTLGKLSHYLADAFTFPHNETFSESLLAHHTYERDLRLYLADRLEQDAVAPEDREGNIVRVLRQLHQEYLSGQSDISRDTQYILKATSLLMACCIPAAL